MDGRYGGYRHKQNGVGLMPRRRPPPLSPPRCGGSDLGLVVMKCPLCSQGPALYTCAARGDSCCMARVHPSLLCSSIPCASSSIKHLGNTSWRKIELRNTGTLTLKHATAIMEHELKKRKLYILIYMHVCKRYYVTYMCMCSFTTTLTCISNFVHLILYSTIQLSLQMIIWWCIELERD